MNGYGTGGKCSGGTEHPPWILDCDTTIKVLYGHQDGAEISYNPKKPGRPSHVLHTYWIGNIRKRPAIGVVPSA